MSTLPSYEKELITFTILSTHNRRILHSSGRIGNSEGSQQRHAKAIIRQLHPSMSVYLGTTMRPRVPLLSPHNIGSWLAGWSLIRYLVSVQPT